MKKEQQRKATDRFYDRKKSREAALESGEETPRAGTEASMEMQPIERRLVFIAPTDGLALERIMGKSDLVGINYLELGLQAAEPVCRIQIVNPYGRSEGYGTGFIVGPNLLITNNHVLEKADMAMKSFVEFDFEEDSNARRKPTKAFDLLPEELFVTDGELDFTLVSVAPTATDQTPIAKYGILRLVEDTGKIRPGEYASIIQHPEGGLKKCCLRENKVVDIFDNWLHYLTDTQPGSSGSPVFNDQWLVAALHHSGVPKIDDGGNILKTDGQPYRESVDDPSTIAWIANEGVRISQIFNSLEKRSAAEPMVTEALRRLRSQGTGPTGPAVITIPIYVTDSIPMEVGELPAEHYRSLDGYDANFLGFDHPVELPNLATNLQSKVAKLKDGSDILTYHHFSIVVNAERRLAFYTAVNIDGGQLQDIPRGKDRWYFDPRLDHRYQSGPELYAKNPLDCGHLVRRLDPSWGLEAAVAVEETFHFTNCSPQHEKLNKKDWLEVEDFILNTAQNAKERITVFTGPVFRDDDMIYRDKYRLPADFWKLVAFINKDGRLRATAYIRTQKNYLESLKFFDDEYKTWQVPVVQIEALTGFSFALPTDADPMAQVAKGAGLESQRRSIRRISSAADLML